MKTKYFTKTALIAANKAARKAGGNHIDPAFLISVPEAYKYPVCMATPVPQSRGSYRYWVAIGCNLSDVHHLLLDMPDGVYARLPVLTVEEDADNLAPMSKKAMATD